MLDRTPSFSPRALSSCGLAILAVLSARDDTPEKSGREVTAGMSWIGISWLRPYWSMPLPAYMRALCASRRAMESSGVSSHCTSLGLIACGAWLPV